MLKIIHSAEHGSKFSSSSRWVWRRMPNVFPERRRLRRGGFEFKVRLCGETPSQQKQYCIPFPWMVSFTIFLRVRITGVVKRTWMGP